MDKGFWITALMVPVLVGAAVRLGWIGGTAPADLGVHAGRLKAPARAPNSVSSQAGLYPDHPRARDAAIEPFEFSGDGATAMRRLAALLRREPNLDITRDDGDYLRAEARSAMLRFVDDVEFWLDEANGVIQLRSASRLGYSDRGVNRARIEALRSAFHAGGTPQPAANTAAAV